jgi:hypothetical protein
MTRPQPRTVVKASFFAFLALSILALSACDQHRPMKENANAWSWQGDLAAPATLNIRNTVGAIEVEPSTDGKVSVVAATRWSRGDASKDVKFQVVSAGNTITICAIWTRGECSEHNYSSRSKQRGVNIGWSSKSDASVAFKVRVPAGVRVDAWTVMGDVTVRAAGPVKARAVSGDIKVGTAVGPVNAETVTGDVDIRMTTVGDTGAIRAATTNGDAVAYVPDFADGRVSASTMNGDIGSDFGTFDVSSQRIGRKLETMLGAGGRSYTVRSLNGSAWLRLINSDGSVGPRVAADAAKGATKATSKQ